MSLRRFLLRPIAYLGGLHASRQAAEFLRAHQRTRQVQDELLGRLIHTFGDSEFGRDHGLGKVRSFEDLKAALPVCGYETYEPYIERVLAGQTQALLPASQAPLMFSLTSGTTGKPKHIPVTPVFADEMRRGWNIFGIRVLKDHPAAWLRPILQISSPMRECTSPSGLPCGAVSGLLAVTQKKIVRRMYVVPPEVPTISDAVSRYYVTLRCGVGRDVSFITTANPSSTIKLIETGQQHAEQLIRDVTDGTCRPPSPIDPDIAGKLRFRRNPALAKRMEEGIARDGCLLPRHFWDIAFLANWTGGTLKLYLRRLRELFGDVPVRDIGLLASEGRFSVPIEDGVAAGIADITSNLLEFIPAESRDESKPPTLRADEVEPGREYFLVFSNWTGLFRYNLDDCVRVVGRYGQSPVIEFLHRGKHTANITGEKITEHQVVEAMRLACQQRGLAVQRFTLQGHFAPVPYYRLRVDELNGGDPAGLAEALDANLRQINIEYESKRKTGRLGEVRVEVLPSGTLSGEEKLHLAARRGRVEQYKHQYLLTDVVEEEAKG